MRSETRARSRRWAHAALVALAILSLGAASVPALDAHAALAILYPAADGARSEAVRACGTVADAARTRCLLDQRYADDAAARTLARTLFDRTGSVAGLEAPYRMDGGWRGFIDIVPALPVGADRRHLAWVVDAMLTLDAFSTAVRARAPRSVRYRVSSIAFRFFRSVDRTTPSAYASDWSIGYNVSGSLHRSQEAVTDTLTHEIFHLNDADHGEFSERVLLPVRDAILAR